MDIINNILLGAAGSIVATVILYVCSSFEFFCQGYYPPFPKKT